MMEIRLEQDLMEANNRLAAGVNRSLSRKGILTLNFLSSPGAGKTTLIEETLRRLRGKANTAVIVGDVQTARDKERFENAGFAAVQINTEGGCHLTAGMVEKALGSLDLVGLDILFIENVGNLVCPAGFQLGEDMKVVLLSTTEGDDKPGKYPSAFFNAQVMLVTKIDLLPHTNFNLDAAKRDALKINPSLTVFEVSSLKDEGMGNWLGWLMQALEAKRKKREL
jgi:hydrogenase nickel incorporation protein HypB